MLSCLQQIPCLSFQSVRIASRGHQAHSQMSFLCTRCQLQRAFPCYPCTGDGRSSLTPPSPPRLGDFADKDPLKMRVFVVLFLENLFTFLFYAYECIACMHVSLQCACPVFVELRRGPQISWTWSYSCEPLGGCWEPNPVLRKSSQCF